MKMLTRWFKSIESIGFKRLALLAFFGWMMMFAETVILPPPGHADPMDTVGVQAAIVCADLDSNPTVGQIMWERNRLLATYIEADENKVMHYAMNNLCPEYQYLAYAALRQIIAGGGVSV